MSVTKLHLWKSLILLKALLAQYPHHADGENLRTLVSAWEDLEAMEDEGMPCNTKEEVNNDKQSI